MWSHGRVPDMRNATPEVRHLPETDQGNRAGVPILTSAVSQWNNEVELRLNNVKTTLKY